jgi:hypothetical protein
VKIFQSWTGYKVVEVAIELAGDGNEDAADCQTRITGITWESSEEGPQI